MSDGYSREEILRSQIEDQEKWMKAIAALQEELAQARERIKVLEEALQTIITPGFCTSERVIRDKVLNDAWALLEKRA